MKVLALFFSDEIIPFAIIRADIYREVGDNLVVVYEGGHKVITDYDYYHEYILDDDAGVELFSSLKQYA